MYSIILGMHPFFILAHTFLPLARLFSLARLFFCWRNFLCGVVCVWPMTNSDTIVSMFIWFCYLEWMIYGGKLIWCDLLTSKIYQVEGTVLVSVRIFVNEMKTYWLKRWNVWTTCKAVNCFSNIARVKYSIVTSHLHLHLLLLRW